MVGLAETLGRWSPKSPSLPVVVPSSAGMFLWNQISRGKYPKWGAGGTSPRQLNAPGPAGGWYEAVVFTERRQFIL